MKYWVRVDYRRGFKTYPLLNKAVGRDPDQKDMHENGWSAWKFKTAALALRARNRLEKVRAGWHTIEFTVEK